MKKSIKINALLSMLKQMLSLLFPLITIPYVSRVLQTANYGQLNFANSVVSYFSLIAGLGITNYAVREGARVRDDKCKIEQFANEVYTINLYSTLISYFLLVTLLTFSIKLQNYRLLILIQSLAILLTTVGTDWINSIYESYLYITVRYLLVQCFALVSMFLFVKQPEDYMIYACITVIATAGGNIFNIVHVRKYVRLKPVKNCNLKKHIRPIFFLFFNAVAVTIYVNSDMTILGLLQDPEITGIYSLSTKIYLVVKQLLNSVIIVSLPRLSLYLGNGDVEAFKKLSNKIMNALCTIMFPAIVGLFLLSKEIILIVGGTEYVTGYLSLRILSISLGFAVIAGFYCCSVMLPFKQEKICFIASLMSAAVNIGLNFITIPLWSLNGAAFTTLLSEAIVFMIYLYTSKKYPKVGCSKHVMYATAIGCVGVICICTWIKLFSLNVYEYVCVSVSCSAIAYFFLQIALKNEIIVYMLTLFTRKIKR